MHPPCFCNPVINTKCVPQRTFYIIYSIHCLSVTMPDIGNKPVFHYYTRPLLIFFIFRYFVPPPTMMIESNFLSLRIFWGGPRPVAFSKILRSSLKTFITQIFFLMEMDGKDINPFQPPPKISLQKCMCSWFRKKEHSVIFYVMKTES